MRFPAGWAAWPLRAALSLPRGWGAQHGPEALKCCVRLRARLLVPGAAKLSLKPGPPAPPAQPFSPSSQNQ